MTKNILVVEDHPLFREALSQLLNITTTTPNVITANSAESGLKLVGQYQQLDLIILDVGLPGLSGAEAVIAFRTRYVLTPILVVSASEDRRDVEAVFRAGAQAFLSKGTDPKILMKAISRLLNNEIVEPEWITPSLNTLPSNETLPALTPRQHEILMLLSRSYSNKEICRRLNLSEQTVKLHVSSILRALKVSSRGQAVLVARRFGLITSDDDEKE